MESSLKRCLTSDEEKIYTNKPLKKKFIEELEARWRKASKDRYEILETEYKRLHGTTGKLSQGDDLPSYLRVHNDQNVSMVDEIFKTIEEMNKAKEAQGKAKKEEQEKIKTQELERELKRQSAEDARILNEQITKLTVAIQSVNLSTIRNGVSTILSDINDYLALPELKGDEKLIKLKEELENLHIEVNEASKEIKFSDKDTVEKLQGLLAKTQQKYIELSTKFTTTAKKLPAIITNEKMLGILEATKKETYLALDEVQGNLQTLKSSTTRESINWSEDKSYAKQVRPKLASIEEEVIKIEKILGEKKAEIGSISSEKENVSPKIRLKEIANLKKIKSSIEKQGVVVTEKTKELETLVTQSVKPQVSEQKKTPLKKIKLPFGEDLVEEYLGPIHKATQQIIKECTSGFWMTKKDRNKFSAAVEFQKQITLLAVAILNEQWTRITPILESIAHQEKNDLYDKFYTTASKGILCGFSITASDKNYFKDVSSKIKNLKAEIEQRVNTVESEPLIIPLVL